MQSQHFCCSASDSRRRIIEDIDRRIREVKANGGDPTPLEQERKALEKAVEPINNAGKFGIFAFFSLLTGLASVLGFFDTFGKADMDSILFESIDVSTRMILLAIGLYFLIKTSTVLLNIFTHSNN